MSTKNEMMNNMQNLNIKDEIRKNEQIQTKGDMLPHGAKQEGGVTMANQPMQDGKDSRPAYTKKEETVSKLTPQ